MNWAALVLIGLTTSAGMGERPGWIAVGQAQTSRVRVRATYDGVPKYTGKGYAVRVVADGRLWQGLTVGSGVVERNGGPWHKEAVRVRAGWADRGFRAMVQRDVMAWGGRNDQYALELAALRAGPVAVESQVTFYWFRPTNTRAARVFGWVAAVLVGWQRPAL